MDTQTNQAATKTEQEAELLLAEYEVKHRREDIIERCRRAVEAFERFAADARREVDRAADLDPSRLVDLPGQVLSASAWGSANAASELSIATKKVAEYMNALGTVDALKGGAR